MRVTIGRFVTKAANVSESFASVRHWVIVVGVRPCRPEMASHARSKTRMQNSSFVRLLRRAALGCAVAVPFALAGAGTSASAATGAGAQAVPVGAPSASIAHSAATYGRTVAL